jgi:p70 ribosomal S6 kinase
MAPEILNRSGHGAEVDWWSLGALVFDMVTGSPPFCANNRKKTMEKILKANVRYPPYLTDSLKDLLKKLLQRDVGKRLGSKGGASSVKAHPWFRKIKWEQVAKKAYPPPFLPIKGGAHDTSNFDTRFTDQPAQDSPVESAAMADAPADLFAGFSYVAETIDLQALGPRWSPGKSPARLGKSPRASPLVHGTVPKPPP